MKKISLLAVSSIVSLIVLLQGCKKEEGQTGPQGPAGLVLSGNIFGFVDLYDSFGSKITVGNDSILVSLDGTAKTTYTNTSGRYEFDSLTTGIYNLTFTKSNYGTQKLLGQQFVGGGNLQRDTKMSVVPNFSVSTLTATDTVGFVVVNGSVSTSDTRKRTVAVFIGSSSAVSADPANYVIFYMPATVTAISSNFNIKIPLADLQDAGFVSGSTVYFAAYGASTDFNTTSSYGDANTGRNYFNAISPLAATTSVVLN